MEDLNIMENLDTYEVLNIYEILEDSFRVHHAIQHGIHLFKSPTSMLPTFAFQTNNGTHRLVFRQRNFSGILSSRQEPEGHRDIEG